MKFSTEALKKSKIDASKLTIEKTSNPGTVPPTSELTFGSTHTDHMMLINWNLEKGWSAPKIVPYGPLSLDPSCTVLQYAATLFEGMKAYKSADDGSLRLFRPNKNMDRMRTSAARLAFPDFDGDTLTELIAKFVRLEERWVPSDPDSSLYIRPSMIATTPGVGVSAATDVLLFVLAFPVGRYYSKGIKPISLLASTKYVRAWHGGTGGHKLGANYAPGLVPQLEAADEGCSQILWLFGPEHQLTEVGTMNLFVVFKQPDGTVELATAPLEDMILPGVTRDSILSLAREHASGKQNIDGLPDNLKVSERKITMSEVIKAQEEGSIVEMFGAGTAAIVTSVNNVSFEGRDIPIPCDSNGLGKMAATLMREIQGRQTGVIESEWSYPVK